MRLYLAQYVHQPFLRNDQCIPIAQEETALPTALSGGEFDVRHDQIVRFYFETFTLV
jgi:hypothetical protein